MRWVHIAARQCMEDSSNQEHKQRKRPFLSDILLPASMIIKSFWWNECIPLFSWVCTMPICLFACTMMPWLPLENSLNLGHEACSLWQCTMHCPHYRVPFDPPTSKKSCTHIMRLMFNDRSLRKSRSCLNAYGTDCSAPVIWFLFIFTLHVSAHICSQHTIVWKDHGLEWRSNCKC